MARGTCDAVPSLVEHVHVPHPHARDFRAARRAIGDSGGEIEKGIIKTPHGSPRSDRVHFERGKGNR